MLEQSREGAEGDAKLGPLAHSAIPQRDAQGPYKKTVGWLNVICEERGGGEGRGLPCGLPVSHSHQYCILLHYCMKILRQKI